MELLDNNCWDCTECDDYGKVIETKEPDWHSGKTRLCEKCLIKALDLIRK